MTGRTAVLTMVYNEARRLPLWTRYYGGLFGDTALFVIDDGSDDGGLDGFAGTVERRPRGEFDDAARADLLSDYAAGLLRRFDCVICVDCDEFLVPDLTKFADLAAYCAAGDAPVNRAAGFELFEMLGADAPLDWSRPLLAQRRFARITHWACKPSVVRRPVRWTPGFHDCDLPARFDGDLYLCHLKLIDVAAALDRLNVTRNLAWSAYALERKFGARQRWSDAAMLELFRAAKAGRRIEPLSGAEAQAVFAARGESAVAPLPPWLTAAF